MIAQSCNNVRALRQRELLDNQGYYKAHLTLRDNKKLSIYVYV